MVAHYPLQRTRRLRRHPRRLHAARLLRDHPPRRPRRLHRPPHRLPAGRRDHGTRTVPFFLEHDTGAEPLATLVGKLAGYQHLAERTGHRWPLLFWLHSSIRERHLHRLFDDAQPPPIFPIATAARDRTTDRNPAEDI